MTDGLAIDRLVALAAPFTDPASRTWWPTLIVAAAVAACVHLTRHGRRGLPSLPDALAPRAAWRSGSTRLDVQLLLTRQLLRLLGAVPALGGGLALATGLVMTLDAWIGRPELEARPAVVAALYTLALLVAWDASRYVLHRLMHAVPALWELHQVHHSAEVLTPLTFHRIHPVESALYALRGALVTGTVAGGAWWLFRDQAVQVTLLGVHAGGFLLNAVFGNLRHSHLWLPFGPRVERWLISPAQHQLHHSADPHEAHANYGTWLAVWDRLGGTLRVAEAPPAAFGLGASPANHAPDDLLSALVGPLRGLAGKLPHPRPLIVGALALLALRAEAQEAPDPADADEDAPSDTAASWDDDDLEAIVVETKRGTPRVAGSAHVVDEATLERFEYDDVHRVLAEVPGVYTRGEDGFGLRPNIGIRGANSDRSAKVTLMEDGVLFAPGPYAAPAAYYFPMTTRLVGVEVFKGPASTRFGPNTVGGAINLRTRPVPTDGAIGGLDLAGGLYTTLKAHGYGGWGDERGGVLGEVSHLSSEGFKDLDTGGSTGFDRQDVMLKGRVASPDDARVHHELIVKGGYGRERSNETYLGLHLDDFEDTPYRRYTATSEGLMRWQRTQASLDWRVRAGDDVDVRTVAYHHWLTRQWRKLNGFAGGPSLHDLLLSPDAGQAAVFLDILRGEEDTTTDDQVLQVGTNDRRFHSFGLQSVMHWRAGSGIVRSQLEVGVRLHGDVVDRIHTEVPFAMRSGRMVPLDGDTLTTLDSRATALAFAGHVHDDLLIGPVRLTPGMRVEVIRTTYANAGSVGTDAEGAASEDGPPQTTVVALPGLGAMVAATSWLDVFAGAHRGFTPVSPGSPEGSLPESSWNFELGARATPGGSHIELVGFFNDYTNIVGQCTLSGGCTDDQLDQSFNGGRTFVWGAEAVAGHTFPIRGGMGFLTQGTYTWTGSAFQTGFVSGFPQFGSVERGDALPYVPEHQGALRLAFQHPRVEVALAANARSAMRDVAGQDEIPTVERIPWTFVVDASTSVRITSHVSAYATVGNVGNRAYAESFRPYGPRPGAPITAMFGVKIKTPPRDL